MNIFDIENANLLKNTVIEASAGTGKTYTLERIVCRLVEEYQIPISSILMVTYTNKAARELRERIRGRLSMRIGEVPSSSPIREVLTRALRDFDETLITTIHGFCHTMLTTYSFESGIPSVGKIDTTGEATAEIILDTFRSLDNLPPFERRLFRAFRKKSASSSIIDICQTLNDNDALRYVRGSDWVSIYPEKEAIDGIRTMESDFDTQQGELYENWRNLTSVEWPVDIFKEFRKIHPSGKSPKIADIAFVRTFIRLDAADSFEKLMAILFEKSERDPSGLMALSRLSSYEIQQDNPEKKPEFSPFRERIALVDKFIFSLSFLYDREQPGKNVYNQIFCAGFLHLLRSRVAPLISRRIYEKGEMEFDDLIDLTVRSLSEAEIHPEFKKSVSRRFRIALIDEFQDTDPAQWQILKSIFGESPDKNFIIVGDPKQSIYRFRGADLAVYHKAVSEAEKRYRLDKNYRSTQKMIEGCNRLFAPFFNTKAGEARYLPVSPGRKDVPEIGRAGINPPIEWMLVPSSSETMLKAPETRKYLFLHIREKIIRLLREETFSNGKRIVPEDIAVITETHNECAMIRDILSEWDIPSLIIKPENLYATREGDEALILLKTLNNPKSSGLLKRLLLSKWIGLHGNEVWYLETNGRLERISVMVTRWKEVVDDGNLVKMFEELFNCGRELIAILGNFIDENRYQELSTSSLDRILLSHEGERSYTNIRHLIELLSREQSRNRLDSEGLLRFFNETSQDSAKGGEELQRLEHDGETVQILTIHTSKGLQFPIVFLAVGMGTLYVPTLHPDSWKFTSDSKRVIDYSLNSQSEIRFTAESWEEQRRLFYVGATRAESKLYLPLLPDSGANKLFSIYALLTASPEDSLRLGNYPLHLSIKRKNAHEWSRTITEKIKSFVTASPNLFDVTSINPGTRPSKNTSERSDKKLWKPPLSFAIEDFGALYPAVESYTSLAHRGSVEGDADRDFSTPPPIVAEERYTPMTLPPGASLGEVIHHLFEVIDFEIAREENLRAFISRKELRSEAEATIRRYFPPRKMESFISSLLEIVWKTLHTPLPETGICLCEIPQKKKIAEMEFLFKVNPFESTIRIDDFSTTLKKGFIRGFIDLIFEANGRLYIADWKSNLLANGDNPYEVSNVRKAMEEHNYRLQYHLYLTALYRYARLLRKEKFVYETDFGGIYYFFVRGISPDSPEKGIFFDKPSEEALLEFSRPFL